MPAKKKRTSRDSDPDSPDRLRARISELLRDLAGAGEYAEDLRQKLVAEERECEFWIDEAERFRNQVVELLRERAKRARPGDES